MKLKELNRYYHHTLIYGNTGSYTAQLYWGVWEYYYHNMAQRNRPVFFCALETLRWWVSSFAYQQDAICTATNSYDLMAAWLDQATVMYIQLQNLP